MFLSSGREHSEKHEVVTVRESRTKIPVNKNIYRLHGAARERRRGRHGAAEGSWRGVSTCAVARPSTVTISRPLVSARARIHA